MQSRIYKSNKYAKKNRTNKQDFISNATDNFDKIKWYWIFKSSSSISGTWTKKIPDHSKTLW